MTVVSGFPLRECPLGHQELIRSVQVRKALSTVQRTMIVFLITFVEPGVLTGQTLHDLRLRVGNSPKPRPKSSPRKFAPRQNRLT